MDLASRKAALRRTLAERRRGVPPEAALRAAEQVARRLAETPEFSACGRLAIYAATDGELSTEPLVRAARRRGRELLWPRLMGDALGFAACGADELVPGYRGIAEPPGALPPVALAAGDLIVLPALALDAAGRRLGRGGGHYDRLLARLRGPIRVGVGYDFQLVELVPAGEGDERVDMVVTDRRLLRTRDA
jgi:5-formyltetrahydrofolate cyclo-ligase